MRFTKQNYHLADIRVLTYDRRRNLVILVDTVAFFSAVVTRTWIKLDILATHLVTAAKYLFGAPAFGAKPSSTASRRSNPTLLAPRHAKSNTSTSSLSLGFPKIPGESPRAIFLDILRRILENYRW